MANPSKQRQWVVEMYIPAVDKWFSLGAYRDEDEAEMQAELARKRLPKEKLRVSSWRKEKA